MSGYNTGTKDSFWQKAKRMLTQQKSEFESLNERPKGMSMEEYKKQRKEADKKLKHHLKTGNMVFVASKALKDKPGYKEVRSFRGNVKRD